MNDRFHAVHLLKTPTPLSPSIIVMLCGNDGCDACAAGDKPSSLVVESYAPQEPSPVRVS